MNQIVVLGCGKIGRMIARFLSRSGDYDVTMADHDEAAIARVARQSDVRTRIVDATDRSALEAVLDGKQAVISALSYRFNPLVARAALASNTHYFDLTEDVETSREVREIARGAKPRLASGVTEEDIARHLYTADLPDPDLLIRTSRGSTRSTCVSAPCRDFLPTRSSTT